MNCSFVGMNFLAHAYLSFNYREIVVGNMISDFLKGSARFGFSGKIQIGITLHRSIDEYTDGHPATQKAKEIFRPSYRLYSGAIVDILYDHFLANDPKEFTDASLAQFATNTYTHLQAHAAELPANFLHAFTYMQAQNWLYGYRFRPGIQNSFNGLARRATYISEAATAFRLFVEHHSFLNECYSDFFPDVKQFAKQELEKLLL